MGSAETAPAAPSFLVADDHPMVRDALGTALRQSFAGARIETAGSMAETMALLEREAEIDALLLDLDMPGMDGLTGIATVRASYPSVPIVVVSAARDGRTMRRVMDLGASAFMPKSASLEAIARVVKAVLDGEVLMPPDAEASESDEEAIDFARRASQLTPQQWRVLALMARGRLNKQIAFELSVGEPTVKAHVTTILRKLGVRSRTQAVILSRHLALEPPKEPIKP
ncbi:MAG: response regulator transcription factor [Alphaproteobacteria bacterium]|nr:response regulator transcription factor [Alphaproteobacteria bacterium]